MLEEIFNNLKKSHPEYSLDQLLYATYNFIETNLSFERIKKDILGYVGINEMEYYLKDVDPKLRHYVEENIFPLYEKNDQGHGIIHILEVIRRSFALNETFHLGLNPNMLFAIAAYHDVGKYIDHSIHEKIAAEKFIKDLVMKKFFTDEERIKMKEAIEDHRSSKEEEPRSVYGKLISSADRNTTIQIVFIRSFFVAKDRMPEMNIEEYLDYTINRLRKRYSEENPENMFFEDDIYRVFLKDMRNLVQQEGEFKNLYCQVNGITDRSKRVSDYSGKSEYGKIYNKKL